MPTTQKSELILALEQIEREKGVRKEEILQTIEGAVASALRKHMGKNAVILATIDPMTAAIKAYLVKKVVPQVTLSESEISPEQAKQVDPGAQMGQEINIPIDPEDFSRIAAQTAKQVLIQKIREMERDNLYEEFKPKEGEVVNGSVHRFLDRNIILDLGKTEAILPLREQIRRERYGIGSRIRAVIIKVDKAQRGPQVVVSRASPLFLKRLFEMEVPEIEEKIVNIVEVSREVGFRAKVAVRSNDSKVDAIGACVGIRGSRIRSIMNELSGERIDLIAYSDAPADFVANAMAPAKVSAVRILDKEAKRAELIIPDDQLSLAIGKDGQNIRLASRLTGWNLEVKSEAQRTQEEEKVREKKLEDVSQLEGVGPKLAELLVQGGMSDIARLAKATVENLVTLQGVGEKTAAKIIKGAQKYMEDRASEDSHGEKDNPAE